METFTYTSKSQPVYYNGYVFDSLLELKYALIIEETHAWLRDGLEIYYNLNALPNGIKGELFCYRPDFLVRDLITGEAQLIEIKPDGFNDESIEKRRKIATRFIKRFAYDWTFNIVFESEITLSEYQWQQYRKIIATQHDWRHKTMHWLTSEQHNLFRQRIFPVCEYGFVAGIDSLISHPLRRTLLLFVLSASVLF